MMLWKIKFCSAQLWHIFLLMMMMMMMMMMMTVMMKDGQEDLDDGEEDRDYRVVASKSHA